jgi:hypothetical protein
MKRIITIAVIFLMAMHGELTAQDGPGMRQFSKDSKAVQLTKGTIRVFDYGHTKVYAYETKGFFNTHAFFVEKNGEGVLIETPPMKDNYEEFINYIAGLGHKEIDAMVSYHLIGEHFFDSTKIKFNKIYSNVHSIEYMNTSGGESLEGLKKAAGEHFDDTKITPNANLEDGPVTIAGMKFIIKSTGIGFDVEMPEINAVHLHMLGHDNHTLVFNAAFIDTVIKELKYFRDQGYDTYFSSHSAPETIGDVTLKIRYLEDLKKVLAVSKNKEEFLSKMDEMYPNFGWNFYLQGSANLLFPQIIKE